MLKSGDATEEHWPMFTLDAKPAPLELGPASIAVVVVNEARCA